MKTDVQNANEAVSPGSRDLAILKKYFPQCFSKPETDENGAVIKERFDIEKLAGLLDKDEVEVKKEGFTLNFLGKSYARYQSNLDSETVIVPDEKNAETDSENVYIVARKSIFKKNCLKLPTYVNIQTWVGKNCWNH